MLKFIEKFMISCWILAGNYYTFDDAENIKKETCKLVLWQETHVEPSNLVTLTLQLEVTQWWKDERSAPEASISYVSAGNVDVSLPVCR